MQKLIIILSLACLGLQTMAQKNQADPQRWTIQSTGAIEWNLNNHAHLPHTDNIEMAGKRVAGIVSYAVDTAGQLAIQRQIFFPQLHPFIKDSDPDWYVYRAYVKDIYDDEVLPTIFVGQKEFVPGKLKQVNIGGQISFEHYPSESGIQLTRTFFPSMSARLFVEEWSLTNSHSKEITINIGQTQLSKIDFGAKGKFTQTIQSDAPYVMMLKAGVPQSFRIKYMAQLNDEGLPET